MFSSCGRKHDNYQRLQKLSAKIISNSNYQSVHNLDCIANLKKTFQFYKVKADTQTAINHRSLQAEQNILAASLEIIILYKAASRFDR